MPIEKTAVLGAGVMGAAIAAHLANVGLECVLLDIVPPELTAAYRERGWTETHPAWRNSLAAQALVRLQQTKPAPFYRKKNASLIQVGNLEDHLHWLANCDWVVEAVVEDLTVKQELLSRVEKVVQPDCIISTNTSGLSIQDLAASLSPRCQGNFLGTHFFNPPRYMKLLEIIPQESTRSEVVASMMQFCEESLGKGVVLGRDVPGFVANRIGTCDVATAIGLMLEGNLSIEAVDAIVAALGRPASAVFGTLDLVGLDVALRVMNNLYENLPGDENRELFRPPAFLEEMQGRGWLGNKTGQGFYKGVKDKQGREGKSVLDYRSLEYGPPRVPDFASLKEANKAKGDAVRQLRLLFAGKDGAGEFPRKYLCRTFRYAACRVDEICENIPALDRAMKWGYNHRLGPFEAWDALGLSQVVQTMEEQGLAVPPRIREMLASGCPSFYLKKAAVLYFYDFAKRDYVREEEHPRQISFPSLKEQGRTVRESPGASLVDLGDGIACLEFHTKMNTIDDDVIQMIFAACDIVEKDFLGLVIGNGDINFSAGANVAKLLAVCRQADWVTLEHMVADFQGANQRLKYLARPVVAAPAGLTLGGGCEIALHAARCRPAGETYMGLVEVGVGLIPAGGGCKELMLRLTEGIPDGLVEAGLNLQHFYVKALQNIVQARVSGSACEAMELGYIRNTEQLSVNRDRQLWEAKQLALGMAPLYRKPLPPLIPVMGEALRGLAEVLLYNMRRGNYLSDYDVQVAKKVVAVLSGGECPEGTLVAEQEILDREREAFLSLCGEPQTQERIAYLLEKGKPLRN